VLPQFPPRLSRSAARALEGLGVTPRTEHTVIDVREGSLTIRDKDGARETVAAHTVIWAAGVVASALATILSRETGSALDRSGRIAVGPDLTLPGHPEVIALGDMAQVHDAAGNALQLPGVAPVAMQEGRYAGRAIRDRVAGREPRAFRYHDKGNLATIGRARAVADLPGRIRLSGFVAWVMWLLIHLWYLIGFQNRLLVFLRWAISFLTHGRGARLITGDEHLP
jgi:NADH dehydrogenase